MIPGDFFLYNMISGVLSPLLFLVLALLVATAVVTGRSVADPDHKRLTATYLCIVLFLSLFTTLFAASHGVGSLLAMAGGDNVEEGDFRLSPSFDENGEPDFGSQLLDDGSESDEDKTGDAVGSLVLALVAGAVLVYHRGKLMELEEEEGFRDGPAAPVFLTYLYASSIVALIAMVVGATQALDGFAHVLAPESLSSGEEDLVREEGARRLFTGAFLALASLAIVVLHHRERNAADEPPEPEPPDQADPDYPIA
jgi:hypothetical protein